MARLGFPTTLEQSRDLGRAAVDVLLAVASTSPGAVLDSTHYPETVPRLTALPGTIVEVRCRCPREVALRRYRARSADRHPGHLDAERTPDELWNDALVEPLGVGPLFEVDTSCEVDVGALAARIRSSTEPR